MIVNEITLTGGPQPLGLQGTLIGVLELLHSRSGADDGLRIRFENGAGKFNSRMPSLGVLNMRNTGPPNLSKMDGESS
jgi:hypothetical protein